MALGKRYGVNIKTISKRWIKDFVLWAMGRWFESFFGPNESVRKNGGTLPQSFFHLGGGKGRKRRGRAIALLSDRSII